jgi:hypothetical protein
MSRDQRPRREAMIDAAADPVAPAGAADGTAPAVATMIAAKPSILLPALVFLTACSAGAVGVALLLSGGVL